MQEVAVSLFGAMNTAVSGLTAQSAAFSNISDNVSNSQTVGFKRTDTSFIDYLSVSTAETNDPGATVAKPDYVNNVQGALAQTDSPLNMAITGQGFFAVSQPVSTANGQTTFAPQQYYTRAGDFTMNSNGYIVNSAGNYLDAWPVDPSTGAVGTNLAPVQISQSSSSPTPTSTVTLSANLPATPATGTPLQSQTTIYDSLGGSHALSVSWAQTTATGATAPTANDWTASITMDGTAVGSADVQFGGNGTAAGTISGLTVADPTTPSATPPSFGLSGPAASTAGSSAGLSIAANFGSGTTQTINLNLGTFGQSGGLTQFAGTTYTEHAITQDGATVGNFSSVSTTAEGDVVVNYDNGKSATVAKVPLTTFNDPDGLQREDGQAFTATISSGTPLTQAAGTSGAGGIVTSSVEQSNVDIASEFSKLIVAQQAYSASTKVITTAQDLLQQTINMKQ